MLWAGHWARKLAIAGKIPVVSFAAILLGAALVAGAAGVAAEAAPLKSHEPTRISKSLPILPLSSYEQLDAQDTEALLRAIQILTANCMKSRGFSYPVALEQPYTPVSIPAGSTTDVYGITSLAQAQKYGYGLTASQRSATSKAPTMTEFIKKYGLSFFVALFGSNPYSPKTKHSEGCAAAGYSVLTLPAFGKSDRELVAQLAGDAESETQDDPAVIKVIHQWSACMARQGFNYSSPVKPEQRAWPTHPSSAEIATAVADVHCKESTHLVLTWRTAEAEFQAKLISSNLSALEVVQKDFEKMIRLAYQVLGEKTTS